MAKAKPSKCRECGRELPTNPVNRICEVLKKCPKCLNVTGQRTVYIPKADSHAENRSVWEEGVREVSCSKAEAGVDGPAL